MTGKQDPELRRLMHGWFGEPWNGCYTDEGVVDEDMRIQVPVGRMCIWCDDVFTDSDSGQAVPMAASAQGAIVGFMHRECLLRQVVGGLDHLASRCCCFVDHDLPTDDLGSLSDGMSAHQEALAVDEYVTKHMGT